jgi:hypothetical protein
LRTAHRQQPELARAHLVQADARVEHEVDLAREQVLQAGAAPR